MNKVHVHQNAYISKLYRKPHYMPFQSMSSMCLETVHVQLAQHESEFGMSLRSEVLSVAERVQSCWKGKLAI